MPSSVSYAWASEKQIQKGCPTTFGKYCPSSKETTRLSSSDALSIGSRRLGRSQRTRQQMPVASVDRCFSLIICRCFASKEGLSADMTYFDAVGP